jgi:secreted trypsin-like serine protease
MRTLWIAAFAGSLASGCMDEGIDSAEESVTGGQPEAGYPAVGYLLSLGAEGCGATVIAPRLAVTAAHCLDTQVRSAQRR